MLISRLICRTARKSSRGGFTLVELLVVIGIIAILAGVALGPITGAIKNGQQSAGIQTARTLALAEFQYANDNNFVYPYSTTSELIASTLVGAGYVSDPGIFVISGTTQVKYTGAAVVNVTPTPPTYSGYAANNVSWDFGIGTGNGANPPAGLTPNAPDETPLVMSDIGAPVALGAAGAIIVTPLTSSPFGTTGVAVCFKSNSSKFIKATAGGAAGATQLIDASWPGYNATTTIP
ncbi:MAG: type II secretion system GspH family protein [Methylacidiphilales bacterium]|nr:type II secretion system GspH family protein [Candidatus Methylacidiphilales bacterium]